MQSITGINSVDFNNINTEEGENLINNLPNEVLSIIFSKLDDNSIQNSSFVCKRWKSLVIYLFRIRYLNSIRQIISSQLSKKGFIEKNIIKELKSDDILLNSIRRKFIFFVSLLELKKFVIKNLNKGLDNPVFEEYNRLLFDTKFFSYALKEADCKEEFVEKIFFKLLDENRFDECLEIAEKTISCPISAFRTFALVVRLLEAGKVDQAKECFSVLCPDVNFNETLHHEVIDNKGRLPLELAYLFAHAITDNEELKGEALQFIEENRRLFEVRGS